MKLFRKPCANESKVHHDTVTTKNLKLQLDNEAQHLANINQYEYIRREHGYDFMPPSQYVPSRSMSEEYEQEETPVNLDAPESDLSDSVLEEMDHNEYGVGKREPVVTKPRGRKSTSALVPPLARQSQSRPQPRQKTRPEQRQPKHLIPPKHQPESVSVSVGSYGRHRSFHNRSPVIEDRHHGKPQREREREKRQERVKPSHREREPVRPRHYTRPSERRYREVEPPFSPPSESEQNPPPRRRKESLYRQEVNNAYDRRSRSNIELGVQSYSDDEQYQPPPKGRKSQVPTAFGYHSDDSAADTWDEQSRHSRYDIDQIEDKYSRDLDFDRSESESERWEDSYRENMYETEEYTPRKRMMDLKDFTTPAYHHRKGHTQRAPSPAVSGREARTEKQANRRRTLPPRDMRDPVQVERSSTPQPGGLGGTRRSSSREFSRLEREAEVPFIEPESVEVELRPPEPRHATRPVHTNHKKVEAKATREKKSRGILGRIRDSVRGEKATRKKDNVYPKTGSSSNVGWNQELREKGSLFDNSPPSERSDMSPSFQFDTPSANVPFPYEDEPVYEERPTRVRSNSPYHVHHTPEMEPPRPRPRRDGKYLASDHAPNEEFWHNEPVEVRRSRSNSSKPFETAQRSIPPLRVNPDYRQRNTPKKSPMSTPYRGSPQITGPGKGVLNLPHRSSPQPPHQTAQLNFNPAHVNAHTPKQKGFIGCY